MSTEKKYWSYQALGWGTYSVWGGALGAYYAHWSLALIAGYLLFFVYSIGLTDLFRREMRRRRWLELPAAQVWLRLGPVVLLIGIIQTMLVISVDAAFTRGNSVFSQTAVLFWLWWGTTMATGTWTGLYFTLTAKRRRQEREVALQLTLREAELRALEAQINPHFLFNCLNSIRALVTVDPPRAQDMVTRLASVLRYSLHQNREHTVSLASEVEATSDYLALEAVRFEERLRVHLAIAPSVQQVQVPAMLLQTLVENAIKHGISQESEGGDLVIRAAQNAGRLCLEVENTGQLLSGASIGTKLGLANTRDRLRLLYGDRASLSLTNGNGKVTATVLIPNAS